MLAKRLALLCFSVIALFHPYTSFNQSIHSVARQANAWMTAEDGILEVSPFNTLQSGRQVPGQVTTSTILEVNPTEYVKLFEKHNGAFRVKIPFNGKTLSLILYNSAAGDETTVSTSTLGEVIVKTGALFRGIIEGDNASLVGLSFFENGDIYGVISTPTDGNIVLGRFDDPLFTGIDQYMIYKESDLLITNDFACRQDELPEVPGSGLNDIQTQNAMAPGDKCVGFGIAVSFNMYSTAFGSSLANTTNYVNALLNNVGAIYATADVYIYLNTLFIYTTAGSDPNNYSAGTYEALLSFGFSLPDNYMNGNLFQLLTNHGLGGGIAWVNVLCVPVGTDPDGGPAAYEYKTSVSANLTTPITQVPTYSWNVMVVTHEFGHNIASPHTHACFWNGNNTAIDGCFTVEGGCAQPGYPAGGGTIMSYCHLGGRPGINFSLGFGPQPATLMVNTINSKTCFTSCCSSNLTIMADPDFCNPPGTNVTVTASGATVYSWRDGTGTFRYGNSISQIVNSNYTVTVTGFANGSCFGDEIVTLTADIACAATTDCFEYTGNIETWTVPDGVTSITIEAKGAQGGSNEDCPGNGGLGAVMKGTFAVTPGQQLKLLVGQQGGNGRSGAGNGGGGGGGSFVATIADIPMIVAGGGGGYQPVYCDPFSPVNIDANTGENGFDGYSDLGGSPSLFGIGGTSGNGATNSPDGGPAAGNGGGFYTDGEVCAFGFPGGGAFVNGGAGVVYPWDPGFGDGGFGGGACCDNWGGGGGGGYSGGGGSWHGPTNGGGGGSYNTGTSTMASVSQTGNGQICITYNAEPAACNPPVISCPAPVTVSCASQVPPVDTNGVRIVTSDCPDTPIRAFQKDSIVNQTCANRYTIYRFYTASNSAGTTRCSQIITVNDLTLPIVTCPAPVTVACSSSVPAPNIASVTASDNCGGTVNVIHVGDVISGRTCANKYTITRTYRGTDLCGNFATCTQLITVNDNVVPIARCKNITVSIDVSGNVTITPAMIDNGSTDNCTLTANLRYSISPSTFSCANAGVNNVTLNVYDECDNLGSCISSVTIIDAIPPTIVPACPTKTITLNAGPGECEVSWDAPPFMAMDNCPAGQYFGSINRVGNICRTNAAWQISGGAGAWGVMFDLVNTSGGQLNLQEVGWFSFANVTHNIYYRTAPGPYAPVQATASAWTLCASRVATHAGFTGPKDIFNLITGTAYDTLKACDPIIVDSSKIGCLTMAAGETRGVYIHAPGQASAYLSIFGDCTTGIFGDANVNTPVNGATYTGGLFTAPFVNSSFGFGNTNWIGHIGYAVATSNRVRLVQTCGAPYGPGCFFPIGCTTLCYTASDASGNVTNCTFDVCVNAYANPKRSLSCNDNIQVSLDENCFATIGADDILEGGPYGCYDDYIVEIRNWTTGQLIDRQPAVPGSQVGSQDIGKNYEAKVIDPATGNSCWGHITIEDKLAPELTCPADVTIGCTASTLPSNTGTPVVDENCSSYTLTYRDNVTQGSCALGYDKRIVRTWTAIDGSGNKGSCVQTITVSIGDLNDVLAPSNYDGVPGNKAMLACDAKIDRNKDVTPHEVAPDTCIDGYLLDSVYWRANPTRPNIYLGVGGAAGRRIPRVLGWNCIDDVNDANFGHPSPDDVYYPAHKNWDALNPNCYGPNTHVMWHGTGRPATQCRNFGTVYKDIVIDLAKPGCDAGPIGCYKVLRQWTVMDWCTGKVGGHNQVIKVADVEGPKILYPDSVVATMDVWSCTGIWEVPPAWLVDNCSNEIHYTVEVEDGTVIGNDESGYVVTGLPRGIQNAYIVAEDCCGNITKKIVRLNVLDNVPPVPVCIRNTVVSLVGGGSPGENITKVFAESLDNGSFDNCSPHIYFKVIRMEELLGTINGRLPPTDNRVACNGLNGDDDPDPVFAPGNQVYFDDFTKFCCADAGKTIMVVLRVFDVDPGTGPIHPNRMGRSGPNLQFVGDLFGHYSDCMVEVDVQDKVVPTLVPPPNIVVSCWFWYDFEKLRDPLDPTFGRIVTDLSVRAKVKTNDLVCQRYCVPNTLHNYPGPSAGAVPPNLPAANIACNYYNSLYNPAHPDNKYELVWGFDGYVLGGCNVTVTVTPNDDNVKCGQGVLTRTFTVRTSTGVTLSRQQTIWIVDCDPFYVNPADYCDPNDDIEWPTCISASLPGRVEIDGCGADLSPDNPRLGRPKVMNNADDNCALIAIEYDDEVFTIEPDACLKVIRTWTVIDWCQYDPSRNILTGRWEYQQVIKVRDNDDPVVTQRPYTCEPAVLDNTTGLCLGHIELCADATDNCSPLDWLFWEYKIDLYNDGVGTHSGYDFVVGSLTKRQFDNGEVPKFTHNPYADNPNSPFCASGTYPIGIHKIRWIVEDGCGNIGVRDELFEVKDCKAPTPYCLTGVITVPMPANGCVTIWAKDLDRGSYDNCTPQSRLKFYFDGDTSATSKTICCSDFVANGANDELIVDVEMWVEDLEGNTDYCKTVIIVQDNQDICDDIVDLKGRINGDLRTESNDVTNPVKMELYENGNMMLERTGSPYTFGDLKLATTYVVKPTRTEDPSNGVTTADIVKIQKHILGQEVITSPYKLIAADVTNNGKITASDISEIRKLILGVTSKFATVESWTFVPKSYVFADPTQPWGAPRTATEVFGTQREVKQSDFVAIKMGDLNGNARASNVMSGSVRTSGKLRMEIDEQEMVAGEVYKVNFKSNDFRNISGYQFTLKFDSEMLNFEGVESGVLGTTESNFGTNRVNEGILTTSWNSGTGTSYGSDETLFTVVFRSVRSGKLSGMLAITSEVTAAEAYEASEEVKGVSLNARTEQGVVESGVFELYQNNPNPFNKETVVSYRLPEAGSVKLSIYDVTGKVIRVYEIQGQKGLNTQKIERSELNGGGVLYYQLDATNHTATKRMVVVE